MSEIAFAVLTPDSKEGYAYERFKVKPTASLVVNLKEAIESTPLAKGDYRSVKVLVQSPNTLVPLNEFQESEMKTYYHFNLPEHENVRVYYDTLPNLQAVLVFGVDENVCRLLEDYYAKALFYSAASTPVLLHFAPEASQEESRRIFAYICKDWMDVFAFSGGKLLVSNTYIVRNANDITYYLLFIAHQMELDQISDELFLAGCTNEKARLLTQLRNYIPNTFFVNPSAEYNRHPLSVNEEIPYDFICFILDR